MNLDFLAVGDITVDTFITLKEASVHCDIDAENCTITMRWGDKIPFESATPIPGVGNSGNAAVSAARLGLSSGLMSWVGTDRNGDDCIAAHGESGVDTTYVTRVSDLPTNAHYVLLYEGERTILVKHQPFPYALPAEFRAPRYLYLSSFGDASLPFHSVLADWLDAHPETKLVFQPGTFQMAFGTEHLKSIYERTDLFACNKQEAERILSLPDTPIRELLVRMHELGPKLVLITDGPNGIYASDGARHFQVPMYPDPRPPVDRTGAGDATASAIAAALALGKPFEEALLWGPVNAMSVVQDLGAQRGLLDRAMLERQLARAPENYRVSSL